MKEKVNLVASDNVKIAADLYKASQPKGWLLLIHMMPETKESWQELVDLLQADRYESLAIDLRGHGESQGGPDGFKQFNDKEHRSSILDLEAGWEFLKSRGALPGKTILFGASIGANLCLQFLAGHPEVGGGVLLSAGNYRGIDSLIFASKLQPEQNILFAVSKNDERSCGNNAEQNKMYYNLAIGGKNRNLIIFEGSEHGTDIFKGENKIKLIVEIKKFLENVKIQ